MAGLRHNPPMAKWKTRHCGNCGTSTEEKEQKYCSECGTELPEHSWGQKAKVLWMAIQKRMVIAALVPLLGMGIALSAEQGNNPTMAQYVGSVYAVAILIAVWEFMFWMIKASWRAEGLRIPLAWGDGFEVRSPGGVVVGTGRPVGVRRDRPCISRQGLFGGRFSMVAEGGDAPRFRTWMLFKLG